MECALLNHGWRAAQDDVDESVFGEREKDRETDGDTHTEREKERERERENFRWTIKSALLNLGRRASPVYAVERVYGVRERHR